MTNLPAIQLQNLSKSYTEGQQTRIILKDVNATFYVGEFVLILGQSGSGKSTLLNLMSGIDTPTGGDILIEDVAINHLSEHQRTLFRRKHIGFIFQFFNLIPTLTVFENITLTMQLNGAITSAQEQAAQALLEKVGLSDRRSTFPDRLSGGEQQRIAILRALAHNPTLVLADEPTGNLDEKTGQTVIELLVSLTRQVNKTLIMATHNPAVVPLADRVYRIEDRSLVLTD
jgi:putative ABC transport system ATP-binding protein